MRSIIRPALGAIAIAIAVATAALPSPAAAQTTQTSTAQLRVTLAIQAECKLTSTADVAFGTTGVIQSPINVTGTIGVQCTNTTPYNVGLDVGSGAGGTIALRKMTSGAGATINYAMYRDAARTLSWGNTVGTDTVSGTGNGAVQTLTVYGQVPAQTTPAPGSYTDMVTVTVTY